MSMSASMLPHTQSFPLAKSLLWKTILHPKRGSLKYSSQARHSRVGIQLCSEAGYQAGYQAGSQAGCEAGSQVPAGGKWTRNDSVYSTRTITAKTPGNN
jgi:hypothetical protein